MFLPSPPSGLASVFPETLLTLLPARKITLMKHDLFFGIRNGGGRVVVSPFRNHFMKIATQIFKFIFRIANVEFVFSALSGLGFY